MLLMIGILALRSCESARSATTRGAPFGSAFSSVARLRDGSVDRPDRERPSVAAFPDLTCRLSQRGSAADSDNLVAVIKPLYRFFNRLQDYTKRTASLSQKAIAVREALLAARDPDRFCSTISRLRASSILLKARRCRSAALERSSMSCMERLPNSSAATTTCCPGFSVALPGVRSQRRKRTSAKRQLRLRSFPARLPTWPRNKRAE
jgi:hypothetical protein